MGIGEKAERALTGLRAWRNSRLPGGLGDFFRQGGNSLLIGRLPTSRLLPPWRKKSPRPPGRRLFLQALSPVSALSAFSPIPINAQLPALAVGQSLRVPSCSPPNPRAW